MIKPFTTLNPTEHKFIMLINVKMPTIVGILTIIIMTNTSPGSLKAREVFIIQHFSPYSCSAESILFEKFFASAMCIRQIYECYQLHRYLLCIVVVIVCNEHWEQGIQIELTFHSKLFSL